MSRKITPNEYQSLVSKESNRTDGSATRIKSFLIGGAICMLGEGIRQLLLYFEVEPDAAAAWTSVLAQLCPPRQF